MNEEQRNREKAFLEFEVGEIEKARPDPRRGRRTGTTVQEAGQRKKDTGDPSDRPWQQAARGEGAGEQLGQAIRELGRVIEYDEELLAFTIPWRRSRGF